MNNLRHRPFPKRASSIFSPACAAHKISLYLADRHCQYWIIPIHHGDGTVAQNNGPCFCPWRPKEFPRQIHKDGPRIYMFRLLRRQSGFWTSRPMLWFAVLWSSFAGFRTVPACKNCPSSIIPLTRTDPTLWNIYVMRVFYRQKDASDAIRLIFGLNHILKRFCAINIYGDLKIKSGAHIN